MARAHVSFMPPMSVSSSGRKCKILALESGAVKLQLIRAGLSRPEPCKYFDCFMCCGDFSELRIRLRNQNLCSRSLRQKLCLINCNRESPQASTHRKTQHAQTEHAAHSTFPRPTAAAAGAHRPDLPSGSGSLQGAITTKPATSAGTLGLLPVPSGLSVSL